ncbi:putative LRR receptor-like serine/threonine-protein kinase [Sesamum alatum]|uniref:non-specific serine/threonine protein kinase n=1 Tax=Sesamum alatum TaxID=300844 RepID=A0AAE1Y8P6_9LAMI|nr:putative LRR receptor-like serine/threonine-protein kinase [Sesamum alatum]
MASPIKFLHLLIFCVSFSAITPSICLNNETDLLALLAFKSSIDLDPLGALKSWNETEHFCSWKGISCSHKHRDRVVRISLSSQGLVGTFSPYLGNLSFLRTINLQNNSFHGQIPQEVGLLRRLRFLELSNNSFIGTIPRNLSQCQNLLFLNLIDNNFSGTIPPQLSSLHQLESLYLSKNKFFGSIPSFLRNLSSLQDLSLGLCGLKGEIPESLAQLQSLKFLNLDENHISGSIPAGLFNISTMQYFQVGTNQLQGALPSNIGRTLPNLKSLFLEDNKFNGPVPFSISNASFLEEIALSHNYFTGPMPRVGGLPYLQEFLMEYNQIQDDLSFISSLVNCTDLQVLAVGGNLLRGSFPESVTNLSYYLEYLTIFSNRVHGNIPSGIRNLGNLNVMYLDDNMLSGPIPLEIGELSNLQQLDLDGNALSNELPYSLGNLTLLNGLYLSGNNLSGSIPPSLRNCTNLLELDLSLNELSGFVPREIMTLASISISFNLSHNAFVGSIPSEVGSFTNLAILDLSNNKFSGVIPNALSKCLVLQYLRLEGNSLQGEIPQELNTLRGLQDLDLSLNNLTGHIPSFLGELDLKKLNLSFNRFKGEVPTRGVFRNRSGISLDGNKELCGGILELELAPCSSLSSSRKKSSTLLKILVPAAVFGSVILAISTYLIVLHNKRRMSRENSSSLPSSINDKFLRLSYSDLLKATDGFSEANLLGVGRFGSVYKGLLDDGQTSVAVKVLNLVVKGASKSFMAECNALRGVRHRNLLKILSVCESIDFQGNEFKSLVYQFKANGSLEKWLYYDTEVGNRSMLQRLNIAIDIAHALEYLHFGTDSTIVHGDLKPSNILLDGDMTAYVGDFGLAKIVSSMVSAQESIRSSTIGIKGTIGYIAPEYAMGERVSTQGDVYSYGILLLEMFTNRRPTDETFEDHDNLHTFVSNALPEHVMEIVDPNLIIQTEHNINREVEDCLIWILSIGVACSRLLPRDRMSMTDVVNELHKIQSLYFAS